MIELQKPFNRATNMTQYIGRILVLVTISMFLDEGFAQETLGLIAPPQDTELALARPVHVEHTLCQQPSGADLQTCISGTCYVPSCFDGSVPEAVVDEDTTTGWVSPPQQHAINLTIDLGGLKEVTSVSVTFGSVYPESFVVERSRTLSGGFEPWNYFSTSCAETFNLLPDQRPMHPSDVVCHRITQSSASDTSPRISRFVLNYQRPFSNSSLPDYRYDRALEEFSEAYRVRIRFVRYETAPQAYDPFGTSTQVLNFPFYIVHDIRVTGRCQCNGHASECNNGLCNCQHGTEGSNCDRCRADFNNRPWESGVYALPSINDAGLANECRPCNCSGYADTCSLLNGIAVCNNCGANTTGTNCHTCRDGFYKVPVNSSSNNDPRFMCESCGCDSCGAVAGNVCDSAGQCTCKANVVGAKCDTCAAGHRTLSCGSPEGCTACRCSARGTLGDPALCDSVFGCSCKSNYTGYDCAECQPGYFHASTTNQSSLEPPCIQCHPNCGSDGCISFGNILGPNCNSCASTQFFDGESVLCLASLSDCPQGNAFYELRSRNQCGRCASECDGCTGPRSDQCLSCRNFLHNGECVAECPSGYFIGSGNTCTMCDSLCTECWGPTAGDCSIENCTAFYSDGTCVSSCDPNTQYPASNNVCMLCDDQCDGCVGPSADECRNCRNARRRDDSGSYTCVQSCNTNEYMLYNECHNCSSLCADGCTGPSASDCTDGCATAEYEGRCYSVCPAGTLLDDRSHTCYDVCPEGTAPSYNRSLCIPCANILDCKECSVNTADLLQCTLCQDGNLVSTIGTCVLTCGSMEYQSGSGAANDPRRCSSCHQECSQNCDGSTNGDCFSCANFEHNGLCVQACPPLFFPDAERVCQPCHSECSTGCTAAGQRNCVGSDYFGCRNLHHETLGCVSACPNDSVLNISSRSCDLCHPSCAKCLSANDDVSCTNCSTGYFLQSIPGQEYGSCQPCHSQCGGDRSCNGPLASNCLDGCADLQHNYDCVTVCGLNTYQSDLHCIDCDDQCIGCSGPGPHACSSCRNAFFNNTCVDQCPTSYFENTHGQCTRCHQQCHDSYGCTGAGAGNCENCANVRSVGGICTSQCPQGEYLVSGTGQCDTCASGCRMCTGPNLSSCTLCDVLVYNESCVSECPTGWYDDGEGNCRVCNIECRGGCNGPSATECESCRGYLYQTTCVSSCPPGHYDEQGTHLCKECHEHCVGGCSGPTQKDCNECLGILDEVLGCVSECPEERFVVNSSLCAVECPESMPFYPDPQLVEGIPTCHESCDDIDDERLRSTTPQKPYRCTALATAANEQNSRLSTADDDTWVPVVIGVAAFITLVIVTGIVLIGLRKKEHADIARSMKLSTSASSIQSSRNMADKTFVNSEFDKTVIQPNSIGVHTPPPAYMSTASLHSPRSVVITPLSQQIDETTDGDEIHTWL